MSGSTTEEYFHPFHPSTFLQLNHITQDVWMGVDFDVSFVGYNSWTKRTGQRAWGKCQGKTRIFRCFRDLRCTWSPAKEKPAFPDFFFSRLHISSLRIVISIHFDGRRYWWEALLYQMIRTISHFSIGCYVSQFVQNIRFSNVFWVRFRCRFSARWL